MWPLADQNTFNKRQKRIRDLEWKSIRPILQNRAPGRFLDVGCGTGYAMAQARKMNFAVTGVEPDIGGHGVVDPNNPQQFVAQAVAEHLPLPDATFDVVFSSHSLEHFHDRDAGLEEIARVLKPDGLAVIGVPTGTMALVNFVSQLIFKTHYRIGRFLLKDRSWTAFSHIFPKAHGSYENWVVFETRDFSIARWHGLISQHLAIQDMVLPGLYPYPDFPQVFPFIKSKRFSSSVVFVCRKLDASAPDEVPEPARQAPQPTPAARPTAPFKWKPALKRVAKAVRVSQPFNSLATNALRAASGGQGKAPEWIIKHLPHVGEVATRLPDGQTLRLWARADDQITNQLFWRGWDGFEPDTIPLFYRLARQSNVTLDVGAFVGLFSLVAALANPQGKVWAFEPFRANFSRLKRNIALNHLKNLRPIQSAVGETDGSAEFFHVTVTRGLPPSSSLSEAFMSGVVDRNHLVSSTVPVLTLDRFVQENGIERVDLMKVDTESTEPQVLRGMKQTLERDHPHIICEVLPGQGTAESLQEILKPLGYRFYQLTDSGPRETSSIEDDAAVRNYLFTTMSAEELAALS